MAQSREVELAGARVVEAIQVQRRQIATSVIQKSILAARVSRVKPVMSGIKLTVFACRTSMPSIKGIRELRGRVSHITGRIVKELPQVGNRHFAVCARVYTSFE
ncbi:MAG: hypothetical protein DDT20_01814 [Firmicutes bacterium]|nr:hypothetical protein [Bacillota bacterium]